MIENGVAAVAVSKRKGKKVRKEKKEKKDTRDVVSSLVPTGTKYSI